IAMTGAYGAVAGRTGSVNQLRSLVMPNGAYPAPASVGKYAELTATADEESAVRAYLQASADRQRAVRGQRGANQKQLDDFTKSLEREGLLRRFVAENGGFGDFA